MAELRENPGRLSFAGGILSWKLAGVSDQEDIAPLPQPLTYHKSGSELRKGIGSFRANRQRSQSFQAIRCAAFVFKSFSARKIKDPVLLRFLPTGSVASLVSGENLAHSLGSVSSCCVEGQDVTAR